MQKIILPVSEDVFPDAIPSSWVLAEDDVTPQELELAQAAALAAARDLHAH